MFGRHIFSKKTSILIFSFDFAPNHGGIMKYSYELSKNLHKLGYNITVLAPHCKGSEEFDSSQPFKIVRMKWVRFNIIRLIPLTIYFILEILRNRVNLVHCTNWIPCGLYCDMSWK